MTDYVAMRIEEGKDAKQYGVKGQQWGVTRSSRALRAAAKINPPAKQAEKKAEASAPANKPSSNIQDHVESSSARYDRLASQAKAGKAKEMTEQDLKFFNARTEALSKVAKLNETQPGWLRDTTTKVVQQSAQRQMQSIADTLADKYIGDTLKAALKGKTEETVEQAIQSGAAAAIRKKAVEDGIKAVLSTKKS